MTVALRLMAGLVAGGSLFVAFHPPLSVARIVVWSVLAWSYAWVCLRLARRLAS